MALPAVVASRVVARPKVQQLGDALAKARLLGAGQLLGEHDAATRKAITMLRNELDAPEEAHVETIAAQGSEASAVAWARRLRGNTGEVTAPWAQWSAIATDERVVPAHGSEEPLGGGERRAASLGSFGGNDDGVDALPERPRDGGTRLSAPAVQRQLNILVDNTRLRRLVQGPLGSGAVLRHAAFAGTARPVSGPQLGLAP